MNLKRPLAVTASMTLLMGALLMTPAMAQDRGAFSALQGVEAQALSSQEMDAVTGKLNAYDIAAALTAEAAQLANQPKLQAADLALASYVTANAVAINAFFAKEGILTPCKSCGH
jgi:crotonobetainyl-CoA:carnitine CoA-transferase CaiB-like acyl-CoA transferase